MCKRTKSGSNWHKARIQVTKIHEKITNARHDFLYKLSTKLVHENQVISTEDFTSEEHGEESPFGEVHHRCILV
jgi:transposase